MTWRSGETALVRYAWQGRTHFGGPAIVVEDDGRRTALYTPMGTPAVRSTMDYATGALGEPRLESWHTTHNLRFLEAGLGTASAQCTKAPAANFCVGIST